MSISLCEVNFTCRLCSGILKNPHQMTCCGRHFCKRCIDDECPASENTTCPECSARSVTYFHDKHFESLVYGHRSRGFTECGTANYANTYIQEKESQFSGNSATVSSENTSVVEQNLKEREEMLHVGKRLLEQSETRATNCRPNFGESDVSDVVGCGKIVSHMDVLSTPHVHSGHSTCADLLTKEKQSNHTLLLTLSHLSSKFTELSNEISKRQDKVEKMLNAQEKVLQTLYTKVETLESRVSSHALLPFSVVIPNIDSYTEGREGDEWISQEFNTGTYSNKGYKLQLSVVPNSLHMRNKEKALSARLLIASGESNHKLNWPFRARFSLVFIDPSGMEKPCEVMGRHTWESPSDESSMQFIACITHIDLIKYIQHDNSLHMCIKDQ